MLNQKIWLYDASNSWVCNNCGEKLQEVQKIEEVDKLALVNQAITNLEKITGTQPTPVAVKDWLIVYAHIDLPLSEIGKYMQMVYKKRGEHSLFTILLSRMITSDDEEKQDDKDDNNNTDGKR